MTAVRVGMRLENYELLGHIGSGGMGDVYRARDERLGRDVAIKVLPEEVAGNAERLARFRQEARTAGTLNHPNLVTIYDIGVTDDQSTYIVMELLEGTTLRALLDEARAERRRIPLRTLIDTATQIASGLSAAHERRIVHRDLKPENIILTTGGRVKILDFGLAKQIEDKPEPDAATARLATAPGTVMGTASYMSPEQARGSSVDHRSDIFSFGVILFEMLTGKRPFDRESIHETLAAIIRDDPPDLAGPAPDSPPALRLTVQHCLEKRPDDRFQSARDLGFQLTSLSTTSQPAVLANPARTPRWRWPMLAGAALLLLVAGVALDRWIKARRPADAPQVRYLTFSGNDSDPAGSPDGKTMAFLSTRDGQQRVWLKQLPGGSEVPLTAGPAAAPRFVPDGSAILYAREVQTGAGLAAVFSLYRTPLVGGDERKVIDNASEGEYAPDGKSIAFIRREPSRTGGLPLWLLVLADADGGNERILHQSQGTGLSGPRFSPDGARLLVTYGAAEAASDGGIRIIHLASKKAHNIELTANATSASWINDREIVYGRFNTLALSRTLSVVIVRQRIDGTASTVLLALPSASYSVDVLRGGRLLVSVPLTRQNLRLVDMASGNARWLTRGFSTDRQPVFSRDGRSVLFTSDRSGNLDLWSVAVDSGVTRQVTDHPAEDWDPAFSPDGKQILWSSNRGGHFEIWRGNVDGTGARQLSHDGEDAENPTQSLDGRTVYASGGGSRAGLWIIEPGGKERRVTTDGAAHPEVSLDGRWIVAHGSPEPASQQLLGYDTTTGQSWTIAKDLSGVSNDAISVGRARLAADGTKVYSIATEASRQRYGVYVQDFIPDRETSATRTIVAGFDDEHQTESFGVSPDGKHLVTAELFRQSTILLVEGLKSIER
jgi:Tol biopolymer transport system component